MTENNSQEMNFLLQSARQGNGINHQPIYISFEIKIP